MERRGILKSFRNKKSGGLLDQFVGVNLEILKLLRFQEINKTAMRKILKSTIAHVKLFRSYADKNDCRI